MTLRSTRQRSGGNNPPPGWTGNRSGVSCALRQLRENAMSATRTDATMSAPNKPSRRLVEGPSAWTAADMRDRESEWAYRLSPAQIEEIETATRNAMRRGLDIAAIRRDDF